MKDETQYLESIVKPLVQQPDSVIVTHSVDERGVLMTLTVAKEDMGQIIGKQGDTARAIRRLLRQFGMTQEKRISIKINEPTS